MWKDCMGSNVRFISEARRSPSLARRAFFLEHAFFFFFNAIYGFFIFFVVTDHNSRSNLDYTAGFSIAARDAKGGRKFKLISESVLDAGRLAVMRIKLDSIVMPHGKLLFGVSGERFACGWIPRPDFVRIE